MAKSYSINKTKFLSENELALLRGTIRRNLHERDAVLLWTLLDTGARITEVLNLTPKDLDSTDQSVLIRGIKGSRDRELPLTPALFTLVEREAAKRQPRVFNISYSRVVQIWDLYRPTQKSIHSLRHTFAIELFKRTKDLRLVQVVLGHKNINNTMVYAEYIYSMPELKRILL